MKILLASSEVHPYSKTGGLADMVGALGKALARAGHEVGIVTPLYAGVRERCPNLTRMESTLNLPIGATRVKGEVWKAHPIDGLTIYFIDQADFFLRPELYQENGVDYPDNAERFIFFSKAIAHLTFHLSPDILHCHDWQAGLAPILVQNEASAAGWRKAPATCFTIHNLAYQGLFPAAKYPLTNLPWNYFTWNGLEFYGHLNCLKGGIAYADRITTVSPRYAREITTPEYGCGLDGLLRYRQSSLAGILNGVDYDEWNTTNNPYIKHPYSAENLEGKIANKIELQRELVLPVRENIPLFVSVTRLADQKGVDILLGALEEMLTSDLQFALLGNGLPMYETAFQQLAARHPEKVAVRVGFDRGLSHRIEAGADFFLMPSRFEPCGLNQMYSLRYGTVPIVRITGGLDDTVADISEGADAADGIKFGEYSSRALAKSIRKALALFAEPNLLLHYQLNGMAADFSWERTAEKFVDTYRRAIQS
jgi:starch synthase